MMTGYRKVRGEMFMLASRGLKKSEKIFQILIIAGIFYVVYILLFLSKFNFNPSATIEFSENFIHAYVRNHRALPSGLVVQVNSEGYDGQLYYLSAMNIFRGGTSPPFYQYTRQRILYPLLAYISAFGNTFLIPWTLLLINFFSVLWGTYIFILILDKYQADLHLAYLFAFNVGFLICIVRDLCEPLFILLVLLSILHLERQQYKMSSILLALAVLAKEITLMIICPLLLYFLIKHKFREMVIYLFPLAIFLIWQVILFIMSGKFPVAESMSYAKFPVIGIIEYLRSLRFPGGIMNYSGLSLLIFAAIQLHVLFKSKRTMTIYSILLWFHIFFVLCMDAIHFPLLDAWGRYAVPLFLFSICHSAQRKEKYNILLILLMILMSVWYFGEKIVRWRVEYFVT